MDKYRQGVLDLFSKNDELLENMLPLLEKISTAEGGAAIDYQPQLAEIVESIKHRDAIDFDVITLTYPFDGTRLTIAAGTTVYDFYNGTVAAPGVAVVKMSNNLARMLKDYMRALTINADRDVIVQLNDTDKIVVRSGSWPLFPHQQFRKVGITTTASTEILVSASTSADAIIQMYGEISPSTAGFTGDVYENQHTMTTDAAYRFETTKLLLRDVTIKVSDHPALMGDSANQRYPRSVGSTYGHEKIDVSKLYLKNAGAGSNTKINIFGTRL